MTALSWLLAAGWLLLLAYAIRWLCHHLTDAEHAARRARVAQDLGRLRHLRHHPPIVDTAPGPPYSDLRIDAELIAAADRKEHAR